MIHRKPWKMVGYRKGPTDFVAMRKEIMALLSEKPMTREQLVQEYIGRCGAEPVSKTLQYLKEDGYVEKEKKTLLWRIKR